MTTINVCPECKAKITRPYDNAKCSNSKPCDICTQPAKHKHANMRIRYKPNFVNDVHNDSNKESGLFIGDLNLETGQIENKIYFKLVVE